MMVLYVANEWDYGDLNAGHNYEHYNFYDPLSRLASRLIYFDYQQICNRAGQNSMNGLLEVAVDEFKPDLLFACFMHDEVSRETMRRISARGDVKTLLWLCDDHWRWEGFSCQWAPCFNYAVTTASDAPAKYEAIGYHSWVKSQWGANTILYRPTTGPKIYDVTVIGRPHGDRHGYVRALVDAGTKVNVWGPRWGTRLSHHEMIRVWGQSKICLNFSESAQPGHRQIKGRHFEIPACGSFQLTNYADNLSDYFSDDEIGVFEGVKDLVDKVHFYLDHEEQREMVALRGYLRTIREHTWEKRFHEIFSRMAL